MKYHSNEHILNALKIANDLMSLANDAQLQTNDNDSNILFGVMRDCAYKLWREVARQHHHNKTTADWRSPSLN